MNGRGVMVAGLLAAVPSLACAPVPGDGKFVRTATEEAIIIWDEGAKRQHFIRRASFDTDAKDFGFLVPTPTQPELGEALDVAFNALATLTAPKRVYADGSPKGEAKAIQMAPMAVTVLEQKVVAGYDAAVLEASDALALDAWLKQNGYPSSPDLVEWLEPYIAAKWKITAFKVEAGARNVVTSAVRMSFQTDQPFFPYREPASQRASKGGKRLLRIYFVADRRFDAALGTQPWAGKAVWSNLIPKEDLAEVLKLAGLPILAGGGGRWVTEFEDRASPRPGIDEVFFHSAASSSTLERPPVIYDSGKAGWTLLVAAFLLTGAIAGFFAWRFNRRRNG